jgi:hypothetical protein
MSLTKATYSMIEGAPANVLDYGADPAGVADSTAAIQAAVNAAYTAYNKTVYVPNGIYKVNGTVTITQGVMIVGAGSQGSNEAYGTVFKHFSNNSCFVWNGSGTAFAGTGGGLKNCLIVKADTYSGGNAIEIVATSDNNRPGEMFFENVLAYGLSSGRWLRGLVVDGTAANTPGSRGVRTIEMVKCRFADVTTANETILLNQVTHFYSHGLACDTGAGATAGITLKGINDGVYFNALGCAGTFNVVANDASNSTTNLTVDGKVGGAFDNRDVNVEGVVCISCNAGLANSSNTLRIVVSKKPGCFVYADTSITNVTGDATLYQIPLNATVFDPYTNWGGNSFTVTVAGRYKVTAMATLSNLGAAHTRADMEVVQTGSATNSVVSVTNPYANATAAGGNNSLAISAEFDCEKGDILATKIAVSGGTKTVSLIGSSGVRYSYFIAEYIP